MSNAIVLYNDDDIVEGEVTDITPPTLPTIEQVQRRIEYLMELAAQGQHSMIIGNGELREYFKTPPGYTAGILRWSAAHPTMKMRRLGNIKWSDD